MKHKLFLSILILVIIGLYFKNCVEDFTEKEINEKIKNYLTDEINTEIKKEINANVSNIVNQFSEDKIKEIKESCKQGPQGPKGDVGSKSSVYQGFYNLENSTRPIAPSSFSTTTPKNISIELNKKNDSQFNLTNIDRWQYTDKQTLVSGYNVDSNSEMDRKSYFGICYKDNNVNLCDFDNMKDDFDNTLIYDSKTQQFKTSSDKCIELSDDKLILKKCDVKTNQDSSDTIGIGKAQQFFLH